jgi:hypothetical protein
VPNALRRGQGGTARNQAFGYGQSQPQSMQMYGWAGSPYDAWNNPFPYGQPYAVPGSFFPHGHPQPQFIHPYLSAAYSSPGSPCGGMPYQAPYGYGQAATVRSHGVTDRQLHPQPTLRAERGEPTDISILNCNVLYEFYYKVVSKTQRVPLASRMGTFGAFLRSLQAFRVPDIAALQEFSMSDHGTVVSHTLPAHRIIYGPPNAPECAVLVYNTTTVQPIGSPDIIGLKGGKTPKYAVGQLFQILANNAFVYAVSVHLPFGCSLPDQHLALEMILGMVAPHAGQIPCIVMGDFNDHKPHGTVNGMFAGWTETTNNLTWSARVPVPPSRADGFTCIDYIFYTGPGIAEVARTFNVTPTTQQSLIPHAAGTALPATPFFSDHVAMSVTFTLT